MALTQKALAEIVTTLRATTGTVIDASGKIATVPADTARIDHSDGQAALLVEAASTNLLPYSAASVGNWLNQSATLTPLSLNALGVFPGVEVATVSTTGDRLQSQNSGWTSGVSYRVSVWYKAGVGGQCRITVRDVDAGQQGTLAGAVGALSFGASTVGAISDIVNTDLGGGIYKVSFLFVPNSTTAANGRIGIGPGTSTPGSSVIALGAQMEAGTTTTSYIPTNGTAVTRAADTCTVDVSALGLGTGFTMAAKGKIWGVPGAPGIVANLDNGVFDNRQIIALNSAGSGIGSQAYAAGVSDASTFVAHTPGSGFAVAVRVGPNAFRTCINGGLGTEDNTVNFIPPAVLRLGGALASQVPARLRLKSLLLYPALLSDASLTTLGTV